MVGIEVAFLRIETVAALGSSGIVVYLITIVELTGIQHLGSVDRMHGINALDGTHLILVGFAPGDGFAPIEMGGYRIALAVFLYLIGLVSSIGRVGQTLADDAVTHPVDKLTVLGVAHLMLVHPKTVHADVAGREGQPPQGIVLCQAHPE